MSSEETRNSTCLLTDLQPDQYGAATSWKNCSVCVSVFHMRSNANQFLCTVYLSACAHGHRQHELIMTLTSTELVNVYHDIT